MRRSERLGSREAADEFDPERRGHRALSRAAGPARGTESNPGSVPPPRALKGVAAREGGSPREGVFPRGAGLDVHQQTVVACALLRTGRGTQRAVQTFGTTTADLLALQAWRTEQPVTHVAMESTASDWKPVFNLLESRFTPWLVNPAHIKAVPGRKTDVQDAEWIADRLQHGLLKPSFIPDRGPRELRELTRYRKSLIEERAREVNRIQKVLEGANIQLSSRVSDILGKSGPRMLAALAAGTTDPAALAALADDRLRATPAERQRALQGLMGAHQQCLLRQPLQHLAALDRPVAELDADVETRLAPFEAARALWESLPGVGRRTAETILAEIGPPVAPFRSPGALAQWGGSRPGTTRARGNAWRGGPFPGTGVCGPPWWKRRRRRAGRRRRPWGPNIGGRPAPRVPNAPRLSSPPASWWISGPSSPGSSPTRTSAWRTSTAATRSRCAGRRSNGWKGSATTSR